MSDPERDAVRAWDARVDRLLHLAQHGASMGIRRAAAIELAEIQPPSGDNDVPTEPEPARGGLKLLADGAVEASHELERFEAQDFRHRTSTGIKGLDMRMRGGLAAGQLTLVGAPTGGGKTTLLAQLCMTAAKQGPVLIVSPEMSDVELAEREIVRLSRKPVWDRNPWTSPDYRRERAREAHTAAAAAIVSARLPLWVSDGTDVGMADVAEMAASIKGLRLLAIDYAQQVAGQDPRTPRYVQVGDVGVRSIEIAKRLGIPVVVASQVNVNTEKGGARSFSFRESENLSHKAHNALVLDVEWDNTDPDERKVKSAWFVCLKQRSGSVFRLQVKYEPGLYSISDHDPMAEQEWSGQTALMPLPSA